MVRAYRPPPPNGPPAPGVPPPPPPPGPDQSSKDTERLRWLIKNCQITGMVNSFRYTYEAACEIAEKHGRDHPNDDDWLEGFRELIDSAMIVKHQTKPTR